MDMNLSKLQEMAKDREALHVAVHGVTKSRTWLRNWTELNWNKEESLQNFLGFQNWDEEGYTYNQNHTTERTLNTFSPTNHFVIVPVQSLGPVWLCTSRDCSMPGLPVHQDLPEFAQIHFIWVSDTIKPSDPLLPSSPFIFCLSQHEGLYQWVSSLHPVAKDWSFSFSISPFNEYWGLIFLKID